MARAGRLANDPGRDPLHHRRCASRECHRLKRSCSQVICDAAEQDAVTRVRGPVPSAGPSAGRLPPLRWRCAMLIGTSATCCLALQNGPCFVRLARLPSRRATDLDLPTVPRSSRRCCRRARGAVCMPGDRRLEHQPFTCARMRLIWPSQLWRGRMQRAQSESEQEQISLPG